MSDPLSMSSADVEKLSEKQASEVVAAWVQAKRVALPEALAGSKSKVHARLGKKALYQLKSVGVAVAEKTAPEAIAAASGVASGDELSAVMTSLIGNGERGLLFARPMRGGGVEVFESVVQDEHGVMSLQRGEMPRGAYRERMKQLRAGENRVLFTTFERVRQELARAMAKNSLSFLPLTLDAQSVLAKLGVTPDETPLHIDQPHNGGVVLADSAASLHDEKEFISWLPPETELSAMAATLEKETSEERKTELAREQSHAFATIAIRSLYATRLWRMAELFEGTARAPQAETARAEARRLLHTTSPSKFLEQLFAKVPAAARTASAAT